MRQAVLSAALALTLVFGGQWLLAEPADRETEPQTAEQAREEPGKTLDGEAVLQVFDGEKTVEMTMAEYLPGVVRGEMPASFEEEALKAQAVAERTFIYYHMAGGRKAAHPEADACMDHRCCNAWTAADKAVEKWGDKAAEYEEKIQKAVRETDGQVMLYDGKPILAAFHSSSAGVTASSGDVWVTDLPYLKSVESPEGEGSVPNYYSVNTFTGQQLREKVLESYPEAVLEGPAEGWITDVTENGSGRVESLRLGGVLLKGTQVRSLLGLRSACFTVESGADSVTFRVTGYGHGVGMSQYGANELARQGKDWQEILQWYYQGVSICSMEQTQA